MPQFPLRQNDQNNVGPTQQEIQNMIMDDWRDSSPELQAEMTFREYMDVRLKNMPMRGNRQQNYEMRKKLGKLSIPYYDGTGKASARTWVQKLDTYFQLNPMLEEDAIKYAALHLDGSAHEWWHHGMVTLGHNQIDTYAKFTERLIDRFDTKDPELHFKELAQLRQWGPIDSYISDFQRLSVLVIDISERRLIVLFVDGLSEPLHGWVKGHDPLTLQDAIRKARDLAPSASRSKFTPKDPHFKKDKDNKPLHRDSQPQKKESKRLDNETLNELRQKKLCFQCREP